MDAASLHPFFGRLIEAAHELAPDDLPLLVRQELTRVGFDHVALYLSDLESRVLLPLVDDGLEPLTIDGTLAGRAFQTEQSVVAESAGGKTVWVPLLDGVERLGILELTAGSLDDELIQGCEHAAGLVAEMIVAKTSYGDGLRTVRRRRPMKAEAELRWAMLPPLSAASHRVRLAAALEPVYEVAGDAFDYAINGDDVHIAVFDAMGHGLEAARMTNLAVAVYRQRRRVGADLLDTYTAIDDAMQQEFPPDRFVTGQLGHLDVRSGSFCWVNAGHPGPLVVRDGKVVSQPELPVSMPFGMGELGEPRVVETSAEPNDRIVFYSDGLVEARSPGGDPFGEQGLIDAIERSYSAEHSPSEVIRRLVHSVLDHSGAQLRDDATVVMAWWKGPSP